MTDQAESLRRLMMQSPPPAADGASRRGALVLAFGCQPGVGTTTISVQLALAWQRRGWSAAFVDASRDGAATDRAVPGTMRASLADLLRQTRTLGEAWLTGPHGLPWLAASRDGTAREERITPGHPLLTQLRLAARRQVVVVDVSDPDELFALLPVTDHCLLITSADVNGVTCAYRVLKQSTGYLRHTGCWLVMNQTTDFKAAQAAYERLALTCDRHLNLALNTAGHLPRELQAIVPDSRRAALPHAAPPAPESFRQALERIVLRLEPALVNCYRRVLGEVAL